MTAASIILKRCWPEFRGRPVRLELPGTTTATDVVTALAAIVSAVAEGRISPEEGQAVSAVIEESASRDGDGRACRPYRGVGEEHRFEMNLTTRLAKLEEHQPPMDSRAAADNKISSIEQWLVELEVKAQTDRDTRL